jgi:hypothetical protein
MNRADQYAVSFEPEHCRIGGVRYHWLICLAKKPDELVSWGNAQTLEMAERAAQDELKDLCSGLTQGGRVLHRLTRRPMGSRIVPRQRQEPGTHKRPSPPAITVARKS